MADDNVKYTTSYNLGPRRNDVLTVEELTRIAIAKAGKGSYQVEENPNKLHEASTLMLDIDKAKRELGWSPKMDSKTAIEKTVEWYLDDRDAAAKCLDQINSYFENRVEK
jgi:CDP-glucose 4,6-dehydratase